MARKPSRPPTLDAQKVAQLLAAAQRRPDLPEFLWRDDPATLDPASKPVRGAPAPAADNAPASPAVESNPRTYGPKRRKIRDRYIGIRFAGVAHSAEDLEDTPRVIKAARLAFEEGLVDTALELLELAIEQSGREPALWLAELEILFLMRDAPQFVASARAFRHAFPKSAEWPEVSRLGRALAPDEPLFGARQGERRHERYGPWPDLPNWIRAPWDLTSEVDAADFHRALVQGDGHG